MLTTFRAAAAALAIMVGAGVAQAQTPPLKLGYVNTATLMQTAPGRAAAESLYAKDSRGYATQAKVWQDSLKKLVDAYTKAEPAMTAAKKASEQEKIQGVQNDFEALNVMAQQKLKARENEVLAPLMELVRTAIDDIRSEGGYAIIFSGDENSPIVSADKNLDITEKVVARLRTMAAKAPAPAAAAPSAMSGAAVKKPPTR